MTGSYCAKCETRVRNITAHIRFRHDLSPVEYEHKYQTGDIDLKQCAICDSDFVASDYGTDTVTCSDECRIELIRKRVPSGEEHRLFGVTGADHPAHGHRHKNSETTSEGVK